MQRLFNLFRLSTFLILTLLMLPAAALAHNITSSPHLAFSPSQVWLALISGLVPLVTYVINHVGPWVSEPVKAAVLVLAAAIAGALYTAVTTNQFGWNATTAQLVVTAILSALVSHHLLWKPSGISTLLGGGSNRVPATTAGVAR